MAIIDVDAIVIRMWHEEAPASRIAVEVENQTGVKTSRSAILGRIFRLRGRKMLPPSDTIQQKKANKRKANKAKVAAKKAAPPRKPTIRLVYVRQPVETVAMENVLPIGMLDLNRTTCHEIIGPVDGANTLYCGATVLRHSFCAHHHSINYYKPRTGATTESRIYKQF